LESCCIRTTKGYGRGLGIILIPHSFLFFMIMKNNKDLEKNVEKVLDNIESDEEIFDKCIVEDEKICANCPHCNYELLGEQRLFSTCPYCMQFMARSDYYKKDNNKNLGK